MPVRFTAIALVIATLAPPARAEYGAVRRSINGTGETLPAGEIEAGLQSIAYGATSDIMVRVPSAALLVGYGRAEVRYRHAASETMRVSPYAAFEPPRHAGFGTDVGWDFGDAREHSVAIGGRLRYGPVATTAASGRPRRRAHAIFLPSVEYDLYRRGDLVYAGMADYLLYAGYTWAWTSFHGGLVVSPASGFVPLPYVYWRF